VAARESAENRAAALAQMADAASATTLRCLSQASGNGSSNLGKPSSGGCRRSSMNSTISGASNVSCRRRPRYPRSILSATAISLIEA
jgi:hypothetical protein